MKILIFNQKGGVGKTTTALNLGAGLAKIGNKTVTLVDLDPQTHLTAAMGLRAETVPWNVSHWLAGNPQFQPEIISAQLQLVAGDCNPAMLRQLKMPIITQTDYVVIDAPPMWTPEVAALMQICDWVLTPMEPEFLSMQGISRLMQRMEMENIAWSRLRLLLCRYDDRLVVHREVRTRLAERFGQNLLPDVIRNNVRLAESPGYGQSIFDYAINSAGAEDYSTLVNAILALEQNSTEIQS